MEATKSVPRKEFDPEELLECSKCHVVKPRKEFYPTTNYWCKGRGCTYYCRDCSRVSAKESLKRRNEVNNATSVDTQS
jgi:hypothetical protein